MTDKEYSEEIPSWTENNNTDTIKRCIIELTKIVNKSKEGIVGLQRTARKNDKLSEKDLAVVLNVTNKTLLNIDSIIVEIKEEY